MFILRTILSIVFFAAAIDALAYVNICEDTSRVYGQCDCRPTPTQLRRHCPWGGCPTSPNDLTNTLIIRDSYTLSANPKLKLSDWVAYEVTRGSIGKARGIDLRGGWKTDSCLVAGETLTDRNYNSLIRKFPEYSRGHAAPLASFVNAPMGNRVNYLSNITPQTKDLNSGPWSILEEKVRALAKRARSVFVLTGPLYEYPNPKDGYVEYDTSGDSVRLPSAYWKVIIHQNLDQQWRIGGFIMPQSSAKDTSICSYYVASIDVISKRTGHDILPNKPTSGTAYEACRFYHNL